MIDSSGSTLKGIAQTLVHLADRELVRTTPGLEAYVAHSLKLVIDELKLSIPGLEPAPNAEMARVFSEAAGSALREGDEQEALSFALRGLAYAPHNPVLWYHAGSACIEIGSLEMAMRLLWHVLWIHPGYADAKRDLDTLTSFFDDGESVGGDGHV